MDSCEGKKREAVWINTVVRVIGSETKIRRRCDASAVINWGVRERILRKVDL